MQLHFSDIFGIDPNVLEKHGAFNISLVADLPLFIDPFLLFESTKQEYQTLHSNILEYVAFLRDKSVQGQITPGLVDHWFYFPEVKQNWFGYSGIGNTGTGLGKEFADALLKNLNTVFSDFGKEKVTRSSHLEKLCIIKSGVGRDNISDFTTNLIKGFLLDYTQQFARNHLKPQQVDTFNILKAVFNYNTERWAAGKYVLPKYGNDYVILTPKDILTKDENWINNRDIIGNFREIAESIPNLQLRELINNYFVSRLPPPQATKRTKRPKQPSKKEVSEAIRKVVEKYPEILDYYIKYKEDKGDEAQSISKEKVRFSESIFIDRIHALINLLNEYTKFSGESGKSLDESLRRVHYLKQVIENNNGYRIFYDKGQPIKREKDIQIMFRLTWIASSYDVNSEVDNGLGPVDYKISKGGTDATLVEFKLASNSKLRQNLQNQVEIYKKANKTDNAIKVIVYFTEEEYLGTLRILDDLRLSTDKYVVLIDARRDNKVSGSNAKDLG